MTATLVLPARLTHADAGPCAAALGAQLRQAVATAAARPAPVVADASALQHFDSSALAVLLDLARTAGALGTRLQVRGLPERLRVLATLYGVADLLPHSPPA